MEREPEDRPSRSRNAGEPDEPADHALVSAARSEDRDAFAALVDRHHAPLLRRLTRQTGDADLAADLAQETFLSALKRIGQLAADEAFAPWLYRIAQNHLRMEYRRKRRRPTVPLDWITGTETARSRPDAPDAGPSMDMHDDLHQAIDRLSPTLREALLLHHVHGYHASEIARMLGISPAAAAKRISRADDHFRAIYRDLQSREQVDPAEPSHG